MPASKKKHQAINDQLPINTITAGLSNGVKRELVLQAMRETGKN